LAILYSLGLKSTSMRSPLSTFSRNAFGIA
jgi:hypothetical protein